MGARKKIVSFLLLSGLLYQLGCSILAWSGANCLISSARELSHVKKEISQSGQPCHATKSESQNKTESKCCCKVKDTDFQASLEFNLQPILLKKHYFTHSPLVSIDSDSFLQNRIFNQIQHRYLKHNKIDVTVNNIIII